jgi:hypothetical protein
VKGALFAALGSVLVLAAIIGVAYIWPTGEPKGALTDSELAWIGRYYRWAESRSGCESVPKAPTERLRLLARRARAECRAEDNWVSVDRAIAAHFFMARSLPANAGIADESHVNVTLGRIASRIAEQNVEVRCWSADDWRRVHHEYTTAFTTVDYWVTGLADHDLNVIHLEGSLCPSLVRFFESAYTPARTLDRADLAEALAVLAHEVEHIRDIHFANSEAVIECYAMQRVRDLVRGEGRSAAFAADIAAYAWDVSYRGRDPTYYTKDCRNDGPLDRHRTSDVWP